MSEYKSNRWAKTLLKKLFKKAANEAYLKDMVSGKDLNHIGLDLVCIHSCGNVFPSRTWKLNYEK
jgi:hypothetical protein